MNQPSVTISMALCIIACGFLVQRSQGFIPTTSSSLLSRGPSIFMSKASEDPNSPPSPSPSPSPSSSSYENPLTQAHPRDKPRRSKANSQRRRLQKNPPQSRADAIAKGRDPLLSLNMNLDYLAKSGRAAHAEELLVRIEKLFAEGYYAIRPDSVSYNSVLNAYMLDDSPEYDSIREVQRLLERMKHLSEDEGLKCVQPNIVTLNTVVGTFAKNGEPEKARQLLNDMEILYQQGDKDLGPNTITFNSVICAFARVQKPQEAEEILKQMMAISRKDNEARADEIKADAIAFNTVLHAWAVSGIRGAPQRAQQLLDHMTKLCNAGNDGVKPDVFSYTATLSSWAAAKDEPQASDRALTLLHQMENQCALGNEDICPNTVAYTAVITCLGRSGRPGAALQAYDILLEMDKRYREGNEDVRPDLILYSSVINAFACSGEDYAGEKAVELLDHMITLAELGHKEFGPNTQVYCSVITALGKSMVRGNADTAHQLLSDMEKMYAFGNNDVAPNTIIFNAVIDAWARSSFVHKALKAESLLHRMEDELEEGNIMYKPDIITYNSVISAGASSFGDKTVKSKAFRIAMDAFKRVQIADGILPTSRTYSLLLKAIRKLIASEDQRDTMSQKIIEYCLRDGLFNKFILTQLELTCSSRKVAYSILEGLGYEGSNPSDMQSIPLAWKCNTNRIR